MLLTEILIKIKETHYIYAEHLYNLCKSEVKAQGIISLFWPTNILVLGS